MAGMPKDNLIELEIEAMANGGRGMGWYDNRPVFVPYTIPGERVQARMTRQDERFAHAEGVRLLAASADRIFPRCAHFGPGKCGLCQWQHIAYEAQLLIKQDVLADQLARLAGLDNAPIRPVIPSPAQWGYNYHMTFQLTHNGKPGFSGVDERQIESIDECHILHPDLLALYHLLDLETLTSANTRRFKLQLGTDGNHMLILSLAADEAPDLETDLPTSVNVLLPDNEPMNLIGDSHSRYHIDGKIFRVTAGSFMRANADAVASLAQTVVRLLDVRQGEAALDLFAGVGVFSAFLADYASLVTLVESYPPAVTDADENLAAYDHVDVIEGAVDEVLAALEDTYSAAVIDPPPAGMSERTAGLLAQRGVERLVYVSSDPAALARDCKRLAKQGYRLAAAQPFDLAPQTYYIDTAALFVR